MTLTERLYHAKCSFYTARRVLDLAEQQVRMTATNQEVNELLAAIQRYTGKPIHVSGWSRGYFFAQPSGHFEWIERRAWLENEQCKLDLVISTASAHGETCHDLLVVPDTRPTHRLGICLLDLEAFEPAPAWAVA